MQIQSIISIFFLFMQISLASFGGVFPIWALTYENIVVKTGEAEQPEKILQVPQKEYEKIFSISQIIPGPAISGLTMIGYKDGGIPLMIAIFAGLLLPGTIFIPILTKFHNRLKDKKTFKYFLKGTSVSIIGLLVFFCIKLIESVYSKFEMENYTHIGILSLIIVGIPFVSHRFKINPILIILFCAFIGFLFLSWIFIILIDSINLK